MYFRTDISSNYSAKLAKSAIQKGLNSLATLVAWSLRNHHNKCVCLWCLHIWRGLFCSLVRSFACVFWLEYFVPLCLCFIVFARACTVQWYGKALVDSYNKVIPHWRPGRVVTGAYGQCQSPARRSMPLEPTSLLRAAHFMFCSIHGWNKSIY